MKRSVLYMLVAVVAAVMLQGCGIIYHGVYSGKAPNSVYRGDNEGTPGLRINPMQFGLTQEQVMSMSDEEYSKLMDRIAQYNELMRNSSYTEGYDASMKSNWTRYRIAAPPAPQHLPSPTELEKLRSLERTAIKTEIVEEVLPPPRRVDYPSEGEFRRAYKQWMINK